MYYIRVFSVQGPWPTYLYCGFYVPPSRAHIQFEQTAQMWAVPSQSIFNIIIYCINLSFFLYIHIFLIANRKAACTRSRCWKLNFNYTVCVCVCKLRFWHSNIIHGASKEIMYSSRSSLNYMMHVVHNED